MRKIFIVAIMFLLMNNIHAQGWFSLGCGLNSQSKTLFADNISGNLFVSGYYYKAGCESDYIVAAWNGLLWDTTYTMNGNGNITAEGILRFQNQIYVGGGFSYCNFSHKRNYGFTRWNGSSWDSINTAFRSSYSLKGMYEYNNLLYCYGTFDSAGIYYSPFIVGWNGTNWIPIGLPHAIPGYGFSACVAFQNELYFGASLLDSALTLYGLVKWDGTTWTRIGNILNGSIFTLAVYNNELYIGGQWFSGLPGWSLFKYDGTSFSSVGGGVNGNVFNLKVIDNKLFVLGQFTRIGTDYPDTLGGIPASCIGIWDGNNWTSFSNDTIYPGAVEDAAVFNNELYITGNFHKINSDTVNNIAKYQGWYLGENNIKKNEFTKVYPNPTNSTINVHLSSFTTNETLLITNLLGEVIHQETISGIDNSIDVSKWSAGVYFYQLLSDKESYRGKFVVQK